MRSAPTTVATDPGIVFTFPGQGSYSYAILRELYTSFPGTSNYFHQADEIGRELLKGNFLSLVSATSDQEHDERLKACPDLDQIGIYLTEVLVATTLIEFGVKPALLVGHSFGELAALAIGGAYSFETGVRIVCDRVRALHSMAQPGAMAAVSSDLERVTRCIEELGTDSIEISVINHPRQAVVSGKLPDLEALSAIANRQGVSLTLLKSRYPYHSSFLARAVAPFRSALEGYDYRPAKVPVYLCMDGMLYSPGSNLPQILSSQFVNTLDFKNVVKTLYNSGYRTFIECGVGNIVTKLIGQNLSEKASEIEALAITTPGGSLREGLAELLAPGFGKGETTFGATEIVDASETNSSAARLLGSMSLVVKDMSQLVENTSRLIEEMTASRGTMTPAEKASAVDSGSAPAAVPHQQTPASIPPDSRAEKSSAPDKRQPATAAVGSSGNNGFRAQPESNHQQQVAFAREECTELPIAIVSMGCVLPGADDAEQYWSNILSGVSGISNLADTDPSAAQDFVAGSDGAQIKIVPDKTYTLLHGGISSVPYDAALLSSAYTQEQFENLTRGQKLLALAVAQSLSSLRIAFNRAESNKVQCIFGATADGSKEYDDALFVESVDTILGTLDEPENLRRAFVEAIEDIWGYKSGDARGLTQHKLYSSVIEQLLGSAIPTCVVDTACSSSLYSTYLGIKSLQDFECDMVLAGGVFAPGPANNTLFAQFRGLTPSQSRPFDASADGVVFGDGAGIVVLKRLPDALAAGDRVLAVIRGIGLSSDGKSPSINVPQVKGQGLAIRNAYERSGVDLNTIQYVEAHATATLVGDAVEFNALKDFMKRDPASPSIELGSVKALIGHTGWAAGAASLIKICKAFEARMIPRQYNYEMPSPEIDLAHSQFTISGTNHTWPDNVARYPRRAAINGFGFGGTNAHLILEDFDDAYHRNLCRELKIQKPVATELAVISIGSLFPGAASMSAGPSSELRFKRESLRLPAKKMLLPDVTDHMDASQYLAALAAEKVFETMPEGWVRFKDAMGVVLGLDSKTERGMRANERIFVDRLRRQVLEHPENGKLSTADLNRILDKLIESIRARNVPSGPYTLPGLMPNVTAGRIANMFDLNGPNIVLNMGDHSLLQSLFVARQLLAHDDCKIVLAGGINANAPRHGSEAEAVLLLALTTVEMARREGLPILTTLNLFASDGKNNIQAEDVPDLNPTLSYKGAQGAPEILGAIRKTREKSLRSVFTQRGNSPFAGRQLVFDPPSSPRKQSSTQVQPRAYAYVQGTPIRYYTPQLTEAGAGGEAKSLRGRRILFVTDQPERWLALEKSGALAPFEYKVICPPGIQLTNSLSLDLTSEETIQRSLSDLAGFEFDTLIAIKDLKDHSNEMLLLDVSDSELSWLDLMFAVCRQNFERLQSKNIPVIAVCQGAYKNGQLDPYTGLAAGFMKSLSRELGGPVCRAINTDEIDLYKTLRQVEIDLGHPGSEVEVCYERGARSIFTLAPVEHLTKDNRPFLDSDSVVIASGGARGVTAVLVEELLRSFGCRVIALGRTDPSSTPENLLSMDEQAFKDYEPQFYKDELGRNKARKITELKREYLGYRAANEVHQVTKRLQSISEKYEYRSVDITSEKAINEVVEETYRQYGRVDLVMHGAGIQVSTALTKKSLSDFRRIIATKLSGLSHLYKACEKYRKGKPIHFHILTSVFSYMGNDGQPDYGAANEAMNRIAACMDSTEKGTQWSSMAWLGWAGIGMTRGSEFAALAAARRLRGVTKEEGQEIFAEMMRGTPTTPINILLADGEIDYYKVAVRTSPFKAPPPISSSAKIRQDFLVMEREISIESAPYLVNHLVGGVPTVPGALIIDYVGEAAYRLRPDLKIIAFEEAFFRKFIKVYPNRKMQVRIEGRVVSEDERETIVKISILSDFVHSSGVTLQKNILQHESLVRMSPTPLTAPKSVELNGMEGRRSVDPYPIEGSPICLSGPFDAMTNLVIGGDQRRADFKFDDLNQSNSESQSMLSKVVLMDSLMRFGVIQGATDNTLPVFVPEACDVMKVYFDFADFDISKLAGAVTFTGANPRPDGERLHMGPVSAIDADGNTLLLVEHGVCRRFGEVKNGHAA
jgi:acyl transferase domain-containing protein/NAD(P)-dependent dehydrogenase (short-subunit alcohol dehydrogenase family)